MSKMLLLWQSDDCMREGLMICFHRRYWPLRA
ncbi:unnamed protein product [Linum tenue]|uniref:Ycf15 n=1 Tax=Linum tenue TaxID=586396 RepID=A0AAV0MPW5_9ROSI|nr:unnamed protein product [Linum tenue]